MNYIGTLLHVSGSRCCRIASSEEIDRQDIDLIVTVDEVVKNVDGKKKKVNVKTYHKPLQPIVFDSALSLEDCIEELVTNGGVLLTKNLRLNWALLKLEHKRMLISSAEINDLHI